jgi:hypothetical protein
MMFEPYVSRLSLERWPCSLIKTGVDLRMTSSPPKLDTVEAIEVTLELDRFLL